MQDWTAAETGHSNSSEIFEYLCEQVESLIRGDAHTLIQGNAGATARLIMAQLAHKYGLAPTIVEVDELKETVEKLYPYRKSVK